MRSRTRFLARFFAACFAFLLAGKAWAQFPQGVKSGVSPEASQSLATLAIPSIIGVNVAHNFVLDFSSGTKCWGTNSYASFPPATSGTTTYTFAVNNASIPSSSTVACPGANAQPEVGTIQTMSTLVATSTLTAAIADGGSGGSSTKLSDLISNILTGGLLTMTTLDTCSGTKHFPFALSVAGGSELTAVPKSAWTDCKQTLTLSIPPGTIVGAGTATAIMTFTMSSP